MADIGLNPPMKGLMHARTAVMTDALAKFGSVIKSAATGNHADGVTTSVAGDINLMGVVSSQGDPNNGGLFAVGDEVSIKDAGDAQVLVLGSTTYAVGDPIIASATPGVGKKLAAETGAEILGYSSQAVITGTNPQLISVWLVKSRRGA